MKIDLSREASIIHTAWNNRYFDFKEKHSKNILEIYGERGSGKTAALQEYVRTHKKKARYFSFAGLSGRKAVSAFADAFDLDNRNPASWEEAGKLFWKKYRKQALHVLLDDLDGFPQWAEFWKSCGLHMYKGKIVVSEIKRCTHEDWWWQKDLFASVFVGRRTLSDYCKYFPDYTKQDVVRLFSMTGGILTLLQELDEHVSMEENLRTMLRYDSAFSRFIPEWLGEYFRTPESYYPILCAMANGKYRLSEIAREAEYPNNKCQTYLQALKKAQLVRTESSEGRKTVTYHLTNSHIAAWCLFVYGRRAQQVSDPDGLLQQVMETVDEKLALPAFYSSCFRYLMFSKKEFLQDYKYLKMSRSFDHSVRYEEGSTPTINYYLLVEGKTLAVVMPERLDQRYTKEDVRRIRNEVEQLDTLIGTDIVIFSVNRFSDWCVHEASVNKLLHFVTAERLKY